MLRLRNIFFSYAQNAILEGASLDAAAGEFTAILGANGAGKSTLVKIASGYLRPASGEVLICGKSAAAMSARSLALCRAVLEQETSLEFNYTVLDTVCLGRFAMSGFFGVDARARKIAEEALEKVGLGGFESKQYLELSGGEQRRVQLARAIAQILERPERKLLLLDEPTANLDPKHSHQTMALCRELCSMGAACVAVVHSVNLAMKYADKCALLKDGRISNFGGTSEVLTAENLSRLYGMDCRIINDGGESVAVLSRR